jgi:formate hydrogenlyase subunit 3/multisubunit Na+/H+ antiporter MnhD subunit
LSANAVLFYVLTYGLTTIGAFGVVAVVERATGSDRMDSFLGLHKRNPLLAAVLLVLFLSLAGIPPLVGFWAKFNLFAAVLGSQPGRFRLRWLLGRRLQRGLALLLFAGAQAGLCDARSGRDAHQGASGDDGGAGGDCGGGGVAGLLPGAAAGLD